MLDKILEQFIDLCNKSMNKKKTRERIIKTIEPLLQEIGEKYEPYMKFFTFLAIILMILLGFNIYYMKQLLQK
jgi:hypothetical protein